jgi:hypothetical protein
MRVKIISPSPPKPPGLSGLVADSTSRTDEKKAVVSVFVEQEIEGIAVCPVPGIPDRVAVEKKSPYSY